MIATVFDTYDEDDTGHFDMLELRGLGIKAWNFSRAEATHVIKYIETHEVSQMHILDLSMMMLGTWCRTMWWTLQTSDYWFPPTPTAIRSHQLLPISQPTH